MSLCQCRCVLHPAVEAQPQRPPEGKGTFVNIPRGCTGTRILNRIEPLSWINNIPEGTSPLMKQLVPRGGEVGNPPMGSNANISPIAIHEEFLPYFCTMFVEFPAISDQVGFSRLTAEPVPATCVVESYSLLEVTRPLG